MRTKALDESNRAAARSGGKEAGVKATSPRTETGCKAGDADGEESEIESVKIWSRLSNPYFLKSEMCCSGIYAVNAHEWFNRASILSNTFGVKASYFVLEDNKPGIYFR